MEREFYPENFEKYLKSTTDQFRITPSKKVWLGIYNDMHPGTRWPSITISFVFIFALVIIGHLNSNNDYKKALHKPQIITAASIQSAASFKRTNKNPYSYVKENTASSKTESGNDNRSFKNNSNPNADLKEIGADALHDNFIIPAKNTVKLNDATTDKKEQISTSTKENSTSLNDINTLSKEVSNNELPKGDADMKKVLPVKKHPTVTSPINEDLTVSKPLKVRNNPALFTYFLSPSLSYRSFSDNKMNNSVTHKPMAGYEAGIAVSSKLINQLRFTTGLQVNYTGYHIKANSTHPLQASIILNSDLPGQLTTYSGVSNYGNGINPKSRLKNYDLQLSAPIGLQYTFGGEEKNKFITEATLQPSYILAGDRYLLSTDKRNYLEYPSLTRKWNMSTNFSTSVSIKSDSYNWQIGPQLRYQLLSSYSKSYPVKEHLINYGIRVSISKISK